MTPFIDMIKIVLNKKEINCEHYRSDIAICRPLEFFHIMLTMDISLLYKHLEMEHYKLIAFAHNGRSLIVGASMGSTTMGRSVCRVGHRVLCIQDLMGI